jgi:lipoprotein-anchoring transpeptidase ErfK/SrfK
MDSYYDRRWFLRDQGQDMHLLASSRHFRGLVVIPFLAVMLAFPARAQTDSDPETLSTGTAGAQSESGSTGGPTSDPATPKTGSDAAIPESTAGIIKTGSTVLINIDKTEQQMTVFVDGVEKYTWAVSTGRRGYSTPSGTFTPTSMNEVWYSKQWDNSPMPHAIFFMKDGHAIHGSYEVKTLGRPVSHGCVRVSPANASILYQLVKEKGLENTQVVLAGDTPGGESKVADQPVYPHYGNADGGPWGPGPGYYYPPPPPRRGLFGGLFGGPYFNGPHGPQGYYRQPPGY